MPWTPINFSNRQAAHRAIRKSYARDKETRLGKDPVRLENGNVDVSPPLHEGKTRSNGVKYPDMMFSPSKPTGKHVPLPNEGPAHRWPSEKDFGHDYTVTRDVR